MIAVDTNILIYAHRRESSVHGLAAQCVAALAEGETAWTIPWPCVHEFFSIVTNRKIYPTPSTITEAFDQVAGWQASPYFHQVAEGSGHLALLREIANQGGIRGGQFHDARIAAICLQHGVSELWTADRDFSRFPALNTRNPLIA